MTQYFHIFIMPSSLLKRLTCVASDNEMSTLWTLGYWLVFFFLLSIPPQANLCGPEERAQTKGLFTFIVLSLYYGLCKGVAKIRLKQKLWRDLMGLCISGFFGCIDLGVLEVKSQFFWILSFLYEVLIVCSPYKCD